MIKQYENGMSTLFSNHLEQSMKWFSDYQKDLSEQVTKTFTQEPFALMNKFMQDNIESMKESQKKWFEMFQPGMPTSKT